MIRLVAKSFGYAVTLFIALAILGQIPGLSEPVYWSNSVCGMWFGLLMFGEGHDLFTVLGVFGSELAFLNVIFAAWFYNWDHRRL